MQNAKGSFAAKLNRLFEERRKADGSKYSKKEVVESSSALNRVLLWRLEAGETTKPSYEVVKALADFFGVHPDYFFNDSDEMPLEAFEADREKQLEMALRFFGLDEAGRKAVRAMVEALRHK